MERAGTTDDGSADLQLVPYDEITASAGAAGGTDPEVAAPVRRTRS